MQNQFLFLIYVIFFLSGAAALIYEVVWVRYLSLVFGGSHLAVTTVLAVFMGGLSLGGYLIGKKVGRCRNLLRLYGILELGIAVSAILFLVVIRLYPIIYVPLARLSETSVVYLSLLRVIFSVILLIIPTTLMGGTLPVLSGLVSRSSKTIGTRLSFLYGSNTLGAVAGAAAAGFFLPRYFPIEVTMSFAVIINVLIGGLCILMQRRARYVQIPIHQDCIEDLETRASTPRSGDAASQLPLKLVIWGIGISGFCALSYEILWTRVLSVAIGASTYGFTIILVAFLSGIAAGSAAYGLISKLDFTLDKGGVRPIVRSAVWFGIVQIIIGTAALAVTAQIRELPAHTVFLERNFLDLIADRFTAMQISSLVLAFSYLFVPAFFMGVAFPMAGKIHASCRGTVGHAIGELLAFNTVGAILGSAVSGFFLIYVLGIERSLQIISLINIGFGLMVIMGARRSAVQVSAAAALTLAVISILVLNPHKWRLWDSRFLAMYQANSPRAFQNAGAIRKTLKNTKVLYYGEGAQAIVSSLEGKAGEQSFITNGRVEASNSPGDMQCQYTLGHLPMLLAKNPRNIFVLGTGSGMTLGATSVYPSVERITLAEIEPKVLGVARSFARYNHDVLNNPKLRIVFNDGRNFLLTTSEKFDVITADPVHPWFSGAGYLYTSEYFALAAKHLNPGGVICQWLPIYELTNANLKSVVKSFMSNFRYTMLWMTQYDAELVGSNSPFDIDEKELDRRIAEPAVLKDLQMIGMGSADDILSYFVMGNKGAEAYSRGGIINTDENLYLEFSAPESMGNSSLDGSNFSDIVKFRESILPYLKLPIEQATRKVMVEKWQNRLRVAKLVDLAHGMSLSGEEETPQFRNLMAMIDSTTSQYAPWLFLKEEYRNEMARKPRLLDQTTIAFMDKSGNEPYLKVSAVISRLSSTYAIIDFVDNRARFIFGSAEVFGKNRDMYIRKLVDSTFQGIREEMEKREQMAVSGENPLNVATMHPTVKRIVTRQLALQGYCN